MYGLRLHVFWFISIVQFIFLYFGIFGEFFNVSIDATNIVPDVTSYEFALMRHPFSLIQDENSKDVKTERKEHVVLTYHAV